MAIQVFGAGVGRTGTFSLKLAINRIGLGPCHHMEAVLHNMPTQVPLWSAAIDGRPDWNAIYEVKQGWGPLCEFLDVPAPDEPFPRTNDRAEFWDRVTGKI